MDGDDGTIPPCPAARSVHPRCRTRRCRMLDTPIRKCPHHYRPHIHPSRMRRRCSLTLHLEHYRARWVALHSRRSATFVRQARSTWCIHRHRPCEGPHGPGPAAAGSTPGKTTSHSEAFSGRPVKCCCPRRNRLPRKSAIQFVTSTHRSRTNPAAAAARSADGPHTRAGGRSRCRACGVGFTSQGPSIRAARRTSHAGRAAPPVTKSFGAT